MAVLSEWGNQNLARSQILSLGLSLGHRSGAAVLLRGHEMVAAATEPRRWGRSPSLPLQAVQFCLNQVGLKDLTGVDVLGMQSRYATDWSDFFASQFSAERGWIEGLLTFPTNLRQELRFRAELREQLENLIHPSAPLPELTLVADELALAQGLLAGVAERPAAILVLDVPFAKMASGLWQASGPDLEPVWLQDFPQSLELLVSNLATFCGFRGRMGQRQFLQLAEYGENRFIELFEQELFKPEERGRFTINLEVLVNDPSRETDWKELGRLLSDEPRQSHQPISSREIDLAHALVHVVTRWTQNLNRFVLDDLKTPRLVVRAAGPLMERVRTPWRRSQVGLEMRFSNPTDEPLIMAGGAALEAMSTKDIYLEAGRALNFRAMPAFRQYPRISTTSPLT